MLPYSTPGVYFERSDVRDHAIGAVRTDIAGFVGVAARGPIHTPVRVRSWSEFVATFGGPIPNGYLACAAQGFFQNGGDVCWAVRVADPVKAKPAGLDLKDDAGNLLLRLTATSPGSWGSHLEA